MAGTTEAAEAAAAVAGTKPAVPFTRRTSIHLTARLEHRDPLTFQRGAEADRTRQCGVSEIFYQPKIAGT